MERTRECRADVGPHLAQSNLLYAVFLNLTSNVQLPSTSLENVTFHLARPLAAHQAQALDAMDVSDTAGGHPSILRGSVFPFAVFATNSASSSCTHYISSGTPTYTASRQSTLTHGGYFAGRSIKGPTPFLHSRFAVSRDGQKLPMTCSARFPPPTPPHTPGMPRSSAGMQPEEHLGPIRRLNDTLDISIPPNPLVTCEVS